MRAQFVPSLILATVIGIAAAAEDVATFSVSRLECVIGNNAAWGDDHRSGYNGIFRMLSPDCDESPYVPFYSGVNLEHYFDERPRHDDGKIFFEPRNAPMTFERVSDTVAELVQPATPFYRVASRTRFELREPYYVDVAYRCTPTENVFQGEYMGVFWASYINAPINKGLYFLRGGSMLDEPQWVQYVTQEHGRDSTVLPEGDETDLSYPEGGGLLFGSLSPLRYSVPFYYGRFRNMVLIYIFKPNPYLRFSHSPSGGGRTPKGDDTNPAWDYQLVIPGFEVGKEYGLDMRVVFKPWVDREDVLKEVRAYLGDGTE